MPHESPWPIALAATLSLVFVALLIERYDVAAAFGVGCLLVLAAWHAGEPAAGAVPAARLPSRPAGWWGMLILIASEATLFGALVGTYVYFRFQNSPWPPDGIPQPKVVVPLILVACLVATTIPMHLASAAARAGRLRATRLAILVALVVQAGYFAWSVHDFADDLGRFGISQDAYSSIYYTLLGTAHAHVFLGLLFNAWLLWKLARGLNTHRADAVQAVAWYWYAVSLLTVVVIGTLLSAAA
jgi:heme/copper-type cytochrome/quinol oxidase subunit 3